MRTDSRRRAGQALVEMAAGMLALALVASALVGFSLYIAKSLDMHRKLRGSAGRGALYSQGGPGSYSSAADSETVKVEPLAAVYIFGSRDVKIREEVFIPNMAIAK